MVILSALPGWITSFILGDTENRWGWTSPGFQFTVPAPGSWILSLRCWIFWKVDTLLVFSVLVFVSSKHPHSWLLSAFSSYSLLSFHPPSIFCVYVFFPSASAHSAALLCFCSVTRPRTSGLFSDTSYLSHYLLHLHSFSNFFSTKFCHSLFKLASVVWWKWCVVFFLSPLSVYFEVLPIPLLSCCVCQIKITLFCYLLFLSF